VTETPKPLFGQYFFEGWREVFCLKREKKNSPTPKHTRM
jgi:hypothetical protein